MDAPVDFWFGTAPDQTRLTPAPATRSRGCGTARRSMQAQTEIAAIAAALAQSEPALQGIAAGSRAVRTCSTATAGGCSIPLFGSVAIVFFIACANVAGLLLTRGLQRHAEYAMRSALGAGRWRLFRQALTESLVLAVVGGLLGAAFAAGIVRLLRTIAGQAVPRADAVPIGWPVLAFGLAAAIVAAAMAGCLPAARASLPDRLRRLNGTRATASRGERRLLGAVADAADRADRRAARRRVAAGAHGLEPRTDASRATAPSTSSPRR